MRRAGVTNNPTEPNREETKDRVQLYGNGIYELCKSTKEQKENSKS